MNKTSCFFKYCFKVISHFYSYASYKCIAFFFAFLLINLPLLLYLPPCSKSDMSRLRLAAGGAIMKLAQEPCYHDIITPEQFQLCGLVINVSFTLHFLNMPFKQRTF